MGLSWPMSSSFVHLAHSFLSVLMEHRMGPHDRGVVRSRGIQRNNHFFGKHVKRTKRRRRVNACGAATTAPEKTFGGGARMTSLQKTLVCYLAHFPLSPVIGTERWDGDGTGRRATLPDGITSCVNSSEMPSIFTGSERRQIQTASFNYDGT
ncbi:hypothetical protein EYF80_014951 [Liparis tanakae]|uniref:Secreted protein n=1 Tax=Liparis tanakae TaxID=230148 RepID=A0A4Z2IAR7_9TELE|nr:hypothetical protein EYF80_014951 [Liparis tanakae]